MKKRISILNYETGWVLDQISERLKSDLMCYNSVTIDASDCIPAADVYIHVYYLKAVPIAGKINIFYVTHVDSRVKVLKIILLSRSSQAIFWCMSKQSADFLRKVIPDSNIDFLFQKSFNFNVSQNVEKYPLIVGLFFRIYSDGRKNKNAIKKLFRLALQYGSDEIRFVINGSGFNSIIEPGTKKYIQSYSESFCRSEYSGLMLTCDYVVAFGRDEGYVSVLDAAAAGVKVIAIAQGYHLDIRLAPGSILTRDADRIIQTIESILKARASSCDITEDTATTMKKCIDKIRLDKKPMSTFSSVARMFLIDNPFKTNIGIKNRLIIIWKDIILQNLRGRKFN
jgi:hypothetical protein